jgi:hypothetical protein
MKHGIAVMLVALVGLASGCWYEEEPVLRPASNVTNGIDAARQIAAARCDHEALCTGFGPGKPYPDRGACFTAFERDGMAKFASCEYGVKVRELRACVTEVRGSACPGIGLPFDWFERAVVCRGTNLCLR